MVSEKHAFVLWRSCSPLFQALRSQEEKSHLSGSALGKVVEPWAFLPVSREQAATPTASLEGSAFYELSSCGSTEVVDTN